MSEHPGKLSINIHCTVQLQDSKKFQFESIFNYTTVLFADIFLHEIPVLQSYVLKLLKILKWPVKKYSKIHIHCRLYFSENL